MDYKKNLHETFILPLGDVISGYSNNKYLNFLLKSQYWTREQIDAYQNEQLRLLIQQSYNNVPFYHELFMDLRLKPEDIQTKEDLYKLPIITKEILKKNKGKHLALNIPKKKLIHTSSSGSTGEPFQFYTTKEAESFKNSTALRGWYWMGYRLGDKYVKISMNSRTSVLKKLQDFINRCLYLSSTQITPKAFEKFADNILKYNPYYLRCYPVPLQILAEQIKEKYGKYTADNLKAINTTGSTLHDDVRNEIQEIFNVKIYDSYGCEGGSSFDECPDLKYYHPAEEYAIAEYLTDGFTLSDPEKPVRHITTDLHNYASPFIRYDTQDYIVLGDQGLCSCGRHFQNIKSIKGRDSDILRTPSGKYLIVENFVAYFEWIEEVEEIQVVQEEKDRIVIRMRVKDSFNDKVYSKLRSYWQNYIGDDVRVILEVVDEIKLTPSGKRRTVIRNENIKLND